MRTCMCLCMRPCVFVCVCVVVVFVIDVTCIIILFFFLVILLVRSFLCDSVHFSTIAISIILSFSPILRAVVPKMYN